MKYSQGLFLFGQVETELFFNAVYCSMAFVLFIIFIIVFLGAYLLSLLCTEVEQFLAMRSPERKFLFHFCVDLTKCATCQISREFLKLKDLRLLFMKVCSFKF